jgi:hypothetical protein
MKSVDRLSERSRRTGNVLLPAKLLGAELSAYGISVSGRRCLVKHDNANVSCRRYSEDYHDRAFGSGGDAAAWGYNSASVPRNRLISRRNEGDHGAPI